MEKIYLKTLDNKKIAANVFKQNTQPKGWVVFVHMMPVVKESWNELAEELEKIGYNGIAIDLRGHGESDGGPEGYLRFSGEEHRQGILDIRVVVDYLIGLGAQKEKIYLIGASIGANLSLQYLTENLKFKKAVLISPGLDYHGLKGDDLVAKLKADQNVFFISAKDDDRVIGNGIETQVLFDKTPDDVSKSIKIFETGGHGTDLIKNQPEIKKLIKNFINS